MHEWIGVDLDGTLAEYDTWKGPFDIGPAIPLMLARVQQWLAEGRQVKIMTARVSGDMAQEITAAVQAWLRGYGLPKLEVTCIKDYGMVELWDDRAVSVEKNTGKVLTSGKS